MGFDTELCVTDESVWKNLVCPICNDIFDNPVLIFKRDCKHLFCDECIKNCLRSSQNCPGTKKLQK